jgi:hypothetical protein
MHSRTSYLGYIGALDITLAYCMARMAGERVGLDTEDIQFVWQLEAVQYHPMRGIGFYFHENANAFKGFDPKHPSARERCPGMFHARRWFDKWAELDDNGVMYADMSFNTYARFRRRYHTEILGYDYGEPFEDERMKRFKPIVPFTPSDLHISFSKRARNVEPDLRKVEEIYDGAEN